MKSDLIGRSIKPLTHIEGGTLYINRIEGIVILTDIANSQQATIVHVAKPGFQVGERVYFHDFIGEELLRGVIVLSND